MPTYEYRCPEGHDFDHFVRSISASQDELPCPTCGKSAKRRVSGGAGLVFKGSGFYITDYGKDGKKDQRAATKAASTKEGAASDAGAAPSDAPTKPADKSIDAPTKESTATPPKSSGSE